MNTYSSVLFRQPGVPLELTLRELPTPGEHQLLVKNTLAGVCGSDTHRLKGDIPAPSTPINFGHEAVGIIEAIGPTPITDSAGNQLSAGDRLYWLPMTKCDACAPCTTGKPIVECENLEWPFPADAPNPAGFQQYSLLTNRNYMVRVPDAVSDGALMAFGCALPTALASVTRIGHVPKSLIVQGAGPVGLASIVAAKHAGVETIIAIGDPHPRLEWARTLGASLALSLTDTTPEERRQLVSAHLGTTGAEAVIEAAGHPSAITEGISLLADSGTYIISGLYSGNGTVPTDFVEINNRNLIIKGCLRNEAQDYVDAVALVEAMSGQVNLEQVIEATYPLHETEQAIQALASGAVKVVVDPHA